MRIEDFDYELPEELIAQTPLEPRDSSRLMVIDRASGEITHKHFFDICDYLKEGDTLVINDSKVIPARIFGEKEGTGAPIEVVLLRRHESDLWEVLTRPGKKTKIGTTIIFGDSLRAHVEDVIEGGNRMLRFEYDKTKEDFFSIIDRLGMMPLPPYITKPLEDKDRYQTVYANERGSAAAPTAGLHFTKELLEKIKEKGVKIAPVMLHVGLGTFRPVKEENIGEHVMHTEYISVSKESADIINSRRAAGGRTVCVGTTSCRTLESVSDDNGIVHPISGDTGIFIYPGYRFKATDALITNFHLPKSTLLMLVSAFYEREKMLEVYNTAVREKYRFFSFGDAMFIE
jgi:S-adenosylmethionine:tRNA ribosyltransferase-isomerase